MSNGIVLLDSKISERSRVQSTGTFLDRTTFLAFEEPVVSDLGEHTSCNSSFEGERRPYLYLLEEALLTLSGGSDPFLLWIVTYDGVYPTVVYSLKCIVHVWMTCDFLRLLSALFLVKNYPQDM